MTTDWWHYLQPGLLLTLNMLLATTIITLIAAVLLTLASTSLWTPLRAFATIYVDFMRGVPVLALLTLVYYGLGAVWVQLGVTPFWVAAFVIAFNEAAYLAEVYRSSIQTISTRQWEAAESLGLSRGSALRLIIAPQALVSALPPTINEVIYLMKATSLASLVAVSELTGSGSSLIAVTFKPLEVYAVLAGIYLCISLPIAYGGRFAERAIRRRFGIAPSQMLSTGRGV